MIFYLSEPMIVQYLKWTAFAIWQLLPLIECLSFIPLHWEHLSSQNFFFLFRYRKKLLVVCLTIFNLFIYWMVIHYSISFSVISSLDVSFCSCCNFTLSNLSSINQIKIRRKFYNTHFGTHPYSFVIIYVTRNRFCYVTIIDLMQIYTEIFHCK